jgi:hypothetical protein
MAGSDFRGPNPGVPFFFTADDFRVLPGFFIGEVTSPEPPAPFFFP